MTALKTSATVSNHKRSDGWLQITPGERFRIRTSVRDTKGIHIMLELIADPRNGVPMHIHQNEDEHFVVLEGSLHIASGNNRFDQSGAALQFNSDRDQKEVM
jgi:mannose-6-phosphate isomerase-like protein (cupin superfamily)